MSHTEELVKKMKSEPDMVLAIKILQEEIKKEKKARLEFYDLIHEDIKAEFINGETVLHAPVASKHWRISMDLSSQMHQFAKNNNLGVVGVEKVMIKLTRNDYEPDIVFFSNEKAKYFTNNQLLFPAPDLAVEILSDSSIKRDRKIKFVDFAAHGVQEYWIVNPEPFELEQYILNNGEYQLKGKYVSGKFLSEVIIGFEVNIDSLIN